ncbi:flavin-containing monooxygenase [Mycobacterium montefiorense]|uniref:(Cyclohexanone) monooxygenase n=1 Tax=Mycobacterium montefiorense TaxID=154654 RepID=A0AA37PJP2_9MYCO|nr:NAD(P)/FAD-dependent oxidoreductase [Mycobacterium montefiorense]GBG38778.1 putative (cyclohexanone) monooxygenase [Mycobacterium montefiorense]GKU34606.1 putative (cyclohexanone) monooxygenase [Mycobacterium montefiorense]GKU38087.1 putative (cyclohexanone) monooxygenase [Mycobacterium montefiorense]GKU43375.1 putative (cyclohexanone) monooxygenase [Mycobacterium montefiorense]GKU49991.1 putative (cyclohexanone) monooxygenase [Mycobacterium montefiorense]
MTEVSDVIVIGAGFGGLYAVHRVASSGLSVTAVEAAPDVGGTWYWNRYPGARCDVESVDYSYSFDETLQQSWQWSERFAAQPEILAYLRHVADRFDLRRHYRFGVDVVGATFDQGDGRWQVDTATGDRYSAQFLLCATGCLSALNRPNIPGVEDFSGEVYFTAAWPREDPDLRGKRVGLIGTGSSGIQVAPIVAAQAEKLVVFQRSANYTIPMPNRPWSTDEQQQIQQQYPERRRVSAYAQAGTPHGTYHKKALDAEPRERVDALWKTWREGGVLFAKTFPDQTSDLSANDVARQFAEERIREIVTDPVVATDLIPVDHPIGTKRICTDNGYYATFNRDNVRLVNLRRERIDVITADAVRTRETEYPCDVLTFATGFDAMTGALTRINPSGPGAQRLRDIWADGPLTFLGLMVPGLPNLFTISGPGSPSVLANMVLHAEVQVDWVIDLIRAARQLGVHEVEPRRDAAVAWTHHVAQAAERTLFPKAASSWYLGANIEGKKRTFMPYIGGFGTYRRHCDDVAAHEYAGLVLTTRSKGK